MVSKFKHGWRQSAGVSSQCDSHLLKASRERGCAVKDGVAVSVGCLAGSGELIGGQRILDQQDCGRSARSHSQGGQGPVRASRGDRCLQQAAMNWRG
jgi:hypothetical protein